MGNVAFHYLYRDASNYKRHNFIIFSNPSNLTLQEIDATIRKCLIEGEWFLHTAWNVPDMHFEKTNLKTDHPLHEYNYLEFTEQPVDSAETISDFLLRISKFPPDFSVLLIFIVCIPPLHPTGPIKRSPKANV